MRRIVATNDKIGELSKLNSEECRHFYSVVTDHKRLMESCNIELELGKFLYIDETFYGSFNDTGEKINYIKPKIVYPGEEENAT